MKYGQRSPADGEGGGAGRGKREGQVCVPSRCKEIEAQSMSARPDPPSHPPTRTAGHMVLRGVSQQWLHTQSQLGNANGHMFRHQMKCDAAVAWVLPSAPPPPPPTAGHGPERVVCALKGRCDVGLDRHVLRHSTCGIQRHRHHRSTHIGSLGSAIINTCR